MEWPFTPESNFGAVSAGRLEYRIEGIDIFNVDEDNAGQVIQDSAGFTRGARVTGALIWDTRDSLFLTRRGEVDRVDSGLLRAADSAETCRTMAFPLKAQNISSCRGT